MSNTDWLILGFWLFAWIITALVVVGGIGVSVILMAWVRGPDHHEAA